MQVQLFTDGSKGKAFIVDAEDMLAEMTFSISPTMIIIDHTEVSPTLRGLGAGRKMLDEIVNYARLNQVKILPLCPFAKGQFDKDESLSDVLK